MIYILTVRIEVDSRAPRAPGAIALPVRGADIAHEERAHAVGIATGHVVSEERLPAGLES